MKRTLGLCVIAISAAIILISLSGQAWGQATTVLRGIVIDATGAAVPEATVSLVNQGTNFERHTLSGHDGGYEFSEVLPGKYLLVVDAQGFSKYERQNIELLVNLPVTVDVHLKVGSRNEIVSVTAETPLLNTTDASLGATINRNQIEELPMEDRNVVAVLSLQAGAVYTTDRLDLDTTPDKHVDTRAGAVNGARSDQQNVTLDGVDVNAQFGGQAFSSVLPVTLDSVEELRVTTTNYGADQGRSSGPQVALVTRGGTNDFHGSLYEYHRNNATSANDFFIKNAEAGSGKPNKPPKLIRNIFGGSIGGPFMKNRFFFFINYEGRRDAEGVSSVRTIPTDALRDGVITYPCATPSQCPGGSVSGLDGRSFSIAAGNNAIGPTQLTKMDPLHIGPSATAIAFLRGYPLPNDTTVGDGLNFTGFRFAGNDNRRFDDGIVRLDYKITANGNHTLFWRGSLRDDVDAQPPVFPTFSGSKDLTNPAFTLVNFSKGFALGYTSVLRSNLVNNFRWGLTRASIGQQGDTAQPWVEIRNLSPFFDLFITRSSSYQLPVHNFVDDVSWTKGVHTIALGTNIRFIRRPSQSLFTSFSGAVANASALDVAGIANKNSPLDPAHNGLPGVDKTFDNSYDYPLMGMMGIVAELDANYNYLKTGALQAQGAPVKRRFGADEYDFYIQDSYRLKPNLTFTYGLRYSLLSPPWETTGTQAEPSFSMGQWFTQRGINMKNEIPSNVDPTVVFNLAGPANGKKGYYNWDYHNFGPRIALAYSPRSEWGPLRAIFGDRDQSVIRAGFGVVYDRIGSGLLQSFDQDGTFGLSTSLTNFVITSVATAPRLGSSMNVIPTNTQSGQNIFPAAPKGGFPFTPPPAGGGLGIFWGLDDTIKTPYSYTFDFSIGRELPRSMSVEFSYVGRLAHRLLSQDDLAMPLDLVDKKSGVDYFSAAKRLSQLGRAGTPTSQINAASVGPTAAYWQNIIMPLQPGDAYNLSCTGPVTPTSPGQFTTDPVQAAYDLFSCNVFNETTPLSQLDYVGSDFSGNAGILGQSGAYYPTKFGPNAFFNKQFHSLYAWRSMGNSSYNAFQATLRKRMTQGLQFDLNYTYSRSIDLSSDAERIHPWAGLNSGQVINAWSPYQLRAVSDFDLTHQINANWIVELPFGRGRAIGKDVGGGLDAIIGGWDLSGLARWSTGFPGNVASGGFWPTNWQLGGQADQIAAVKTGTNIIKSGPNAGTPNMFLNPTAALAAFVHPFPGQSGVRNAIRGDGVAGLDLGLHKSWKMPYAEKHLLQFRWEVFNVPNLKRFNIQGQTTEIDQASAFGNYTGLLTNPRIMQFALRYEF